MSYVIHKVKKGESLPSIAEKYKSVQWEKIYFDSKNFDLRRKRPNPHILYPGDEIAIPLKEDRIDNAKTEMKHKFVRRKNKVMLRIRMLDSSGNPLEGYAYKLEIGSQIYEGLTRKNGLIEHSINPDIREGILNFWIDAERKNVCITFLLKIAHLHPVEYITGVQARLKNLGFYFGPIDGIFNAKTEAAIRDFQKKYGLKVDGIPEVDTQKKLEEVYGC